MIQRNGNNLSPGGKTSRRREVETAISFGLVGVANTAIDFAVFWYLVTHRSLDPVGANAVSQSIAIVNSYLMNRFWTFRQSSPKIRPAASFLMFVAVSVAGMAIASLVIIALSGLSAPLFAKAASIVVTFGWNYTLNRYLVFKESRE
jgi:putative flippase GtrA